MTAPEQAGGRSGSWLAAHHDRWATSVEVLQSTVTSAGHRRAVFERLVVGQANEVYAAETADGHQLIVRVSHKTNPRFEMEAAAIMRVRREGVPAPEVLLVERLDASTGASAVMVQRRLPGVMLATVDEPDRYATDLARLLATVHGVTVGGFGSLDARLRGETDDYAAWFLDTLADQMLPAARDAVGDDRETLRAIDLAGELLLAARPLLAAQPSRLAWGDCGPLNILVDSAQISGLIDWEGAKAAPAANDLAWWTCFHDHVIPAHDLVAAYREVADVDDTLDHVRLLAAVRIGLFFFGYAAGVGDAEGLARHRPRFLAIVDELAHLS